MAAPLAPVVAAATGSIGTPIIVGGVVVVVALYVVWQVLDSIVAGGTDEDTVEITITKDMNIQAKKTRSPAKMVMTASKDAASASAPVSELRDPEVAKTYRAALAAAVVGMLITNGVDPAVAKNTVHQTMAPYVSEAAGARVISSSSAANPTLE